MAQQAKSNLTIGHDRAPALGVAGRTGQGRGYRIANHDVWPQLIPARAGNADGAKPPGRAP